MYDFSSVKAEFIASVPGKFERNNRKWGLARLKEVLQSIPASEKGELFAQVNIVSHDYLNPPTPAAPNLKPCLQSIFEITITPSILPSFLTLVLLNRIPR